MEDKRYWFMTLHATCLKILRKNGIFSDIASYDDLKDFCEKARLRFDESPEDVVSGDQVTEGSAFFSLSSFLTNTMKPFSEWKECPFAEDLGANDFESLTESWASFKSDRNLIDFNDMLQLGDKCIKGHPTDVLMVDEFQDLSPLQLEIVKKFMTQKERVYIAGDDDQALYRFQGAEPEIMLDFPATNVNILSQSYRVPRIVFEKATELISQNVTRQPKQIAPRNAEGECVILNQKGLTYIIPEIKGTAYILMRTNKLVSRLSWELSAMGVPYRFLDSKKDKSWGWTKRKVQMMDKLFQEPIRDRMTLLNYMFKSGKITRGMKAFLSGYIWRDKPIIPENIHTYLGTIHSSKGREADTVFLFDDITRRVMDGMTTVRGLEDERRVWYVGMTRARQKLVVVHNYYDQGSFDLPGRIGCIIKEDNEGMFR
jgi:DNA helicase-2/ATP-dependent DNA helicase PcrA